MFKKTNLRQFRRNFCETVTAPADNPDKYKERNLKIKHSTKITKYFNSAPHLQEIKQYIPTKYFQNKKGHSAENLYLIDTKIAKTIAAHVLPGINEGPQVICETAAGLGLIASELLDCKVKLVRLYEPCPDFRHALRDFNNVYPGRVELFVKDIFQLNRISGMDKMDRNNRVEQLLKGVPKKQWSQGPAMTIIGVMTKISFISYLMKMLALQSEIINHGRIQLYCVMRPGDFIKLSAGPELNLHTYQGWSVLFNLLFDYKLLEKFPRKAFLPWEMNDNISSRTRFIKRVDLDHMYFIRVNFKRRLPVGSEDLLPLYYFVRQFFGRGTNKIIPTIEKWIPGCGLNILMPHKNHPNYYKNMNIFTKFGELTPLEILALFKEMIHHPSYNGSSFAAMVEAELLKSETRETDINDEMPFTEHIADDLEEKLDLH